MFIYVRDRCHAPVNLNVVHGTIVSFVEMEKFKTKQSTKVMLTFTGVKVCSCRLALSAVTLVRWVVLVVQWFGVRLVIERSLG